MLSIILLAAAGGATLSLIALWSVHFPNLGIVTKAIKILGYAVMIGVLLLCLGFAAYYGESYAKDQGTFASVGTFAAWVISAIAGVFIGLCIAAIIQFILVEKLKWYEHDGKTYQWVGWKTV